MIIYLSGAAIAVAVILAIYLAMFHFGNLNERSHAAYFAAIFASIGGFLSVASGANKIELDIQNSIFTKIFHGMLRIAIAVISGIIVYFAIDAEIMFSVLKKSDSPYAIFLACSVAGFVEKLVPNLMLKMGSGKPMLKEKHGDTTPKQTE